MLENEAVKVLNAYLSFSFSLCRSVVLVLAMPAGGKKEFFESIVNSI